VLQASHRLRFGCRIGADDERLRRRLHVERRRQLAQLARLYK
jgi:hypothetical protein